MSEHVSRKRRRKRRRLNARGKLLVGILSVILIAIIAAIVAFAVRFGDPERRAAAGVKAAESIDGKQNKKGGNMTAEEIEAAKAQRLERMNSFKAPTVNLTDDTAGQSAAKGHALLAAQYDYDAAIEAVKADKSLSQTEADQYIAEYETAKAGLVRQDIGTITHIFFHILAVDTTRCFNEKLCGSQAGGYNSLMTTIPEFKAIMQSMYDRGYVLVSLHDMAHMEKQSDGSEKMVEGDIMLPPGKKAFVMSEDDVCYYEYMKGQGFAEKMVIGDNGRPTTLYTDAAGNQSTGPYDMVPILDEFIDEHPDFSYHGHKACLVFTGYNGALGYRTDETYLPENAVAHKVETGHDVEAERREAVEVMKALVADGYDLGSHSWGHRDMGAGTFEWFKGDCDKWERNVNSLIREATGQGTDILIYPKGADIGDWKSYTANGKPECLQRFNYLYDLGFRYFCNVDNSKYWVQKGEKYLRQGRRALDGWVMWLDLSQGYDRLSDLYDVSAVFDKARPTPVPSY